MAQEPFAKRHRGETSDQSSNLDDVHVPEEKHEYTRTLTGVELHDKEMLEVVCTSKPDKADEMIGRLKMMSLGLYPRFIGVDVKFTRRDEPPQMAIVLQLCMEELCLVYHIATATKCGRKEYDSLADVVAGVIHPFYKAMKKKIDKEKDHKLWGISPLPDYLIGYANTDAYATYKSWKIIDNTTTSAEISKEQEEDLYYHYHYAG
ncbi:hypothetical protein VPH35_128588 [Triticum aestivum]